MLQKKEKNGGSKNIKTKKAENSEEVTIRRLVGTYCYV